MCLPLLSVSCSPTCGPRLAHLKYYSRVTGVDHSVCQITEAKFYMSSNLHHFLYDLEQVTALNHISLYFSFKKGNKEGQHCDNACKELVISTCLAHASTW